MQGKEFQSKNLGIVYLYLSENEVGCPGAWCSPKLAVGGHTHARCWWGTSALIIAAAVEANAASSEPKAASSQYDVLPVPLSVASTGQPNPWSSALGPRHIPR